VTLAGVTPKPLATAEAESFRGFMNSSRSTSPGWTGGSLFLRLLMDVTPRESAMPEALGLFAGKARNHWPKLRRSLEGVNSAAPPALLDPKGITIDTFR
jgi:hypothetical protein